MILATLTLLAKKAVRGAAKKAVKKIAKKLTKTAKKATLQKAVKPAKKAAKPAKKAAKPAKAVKKAAAAKSTKALAKPAKSNDKPKGPMRTLNTYALFMLQNKDKFPMDKFDGTHTEKLKARGMAVAEAYRKLAPADMDRLKALSKTWKVPVKAKAKRAQKEKKEKRAPGAYALFVKENMANVQGESVKDKMIAIAALWRAKKEQGGGAVPPAPTDAGPAEPVTEPEEVDDTNAAEIEAPATSATPTPAPTTPVKPPTPAPTTPAKPPTPAASV